MVDRLSEAGRREQWCRIISNGDDLIIMCATLLDDGDNKYEHIEERRATEVWISRFVD